MNAETRRIYQGEEEIRAALERGEPLVPVGEKSENEKSEIEQSYEAVLHGRAVSFQSLLNEKRRQERKDQ